MLWCTLPCCSNNRKPLKRELCCTQQTSWGCISVARAEVEIDGLVSAVMNLCVCNWWELSQISESRKKLLHFLVFQLNPNTVEIVFALTQWVCESVRKGKAYHQSKRVAEMQITVCHQCLFTMKCWSDLVLHLHKIWALLRDRVNKDLPNWSNRACDILHFP